MKRSEKRKMETKSHSIKYIFIIIIMIINVIYVKCENLAYFSFQVEYTKKITGI